MCGPIKIVNIYQKQFYPIFNTNPISQCLQDPFIRKTSPDQHDFMWIWTARTLHINRISILKDTLQYLRHSNHSFQHLLKVILQKEQQRVFEF